MSIDWTPLKKIIEQNNRFVLTSHVRPDADALGSELGMASLLRSLGKSVQIINPGATHEHLGFLDPEDDVKSIHNTPALKQAILDCEVHIILDTSAWSQLGEVGKVMPNASTKKVVIDHHVSSDDLDAIEFKNTTSPATGCLVYEFMQSMNHTPNAHAANCLYAAIATDTGWFRFPLTTSKTMRTIAGLMDAGADPASLYNQLYEQAALPRLHLSGVALQRVATACEGQLVYTQVTQADFLATKAHPADTENLVNQCMKIAGTRAAFIMVEQKNRSFKVSLRSRLNFDVTPIAEQLGGGGHRQASGAMLPGPLDQALEKLIGLFEQELKKQVPDEQVNS